MRNKSGFRYSLAAVFDVRTTFYTGATHSVVKKERKEAKIAPKSGVYSWCRRRKLSATIHVSRAANGFDNRDKTSGPFRTD